VEFLVSARPKTYFFVGIALCALFALTAITPALGEEVQKFIGPDLNDSHATANAAVPAGFAGLSVVEPFISDSTSNEDDQTTTIVQMSDPQFFYPDSRRASDLSSEELAKRAIRYAEQQKPDFVIITGDMVQHRGNKEEIAAFWRLFKPLSVTVPLYLVPGNHDLNHEPASIAAYREHFGKDYYAFQLKEDRFLVLNSMLLLSKAAKTKATADQWTWLEAELKKAKAAQARYLLVFLHHPLFAITPHEPEGFYNLPLKVRKRLFHLFEQHGVDAVFAGHYHRNLVNKHKGIDYVVTGSVCAPVVREDPEGVRIIQLMPEGITHRYVKQVDYENQRKQRKL
jgi:3',5'-cyclic AMP phosphodiesterase CpdA